MRSTWSCFWRAGCIRPRRRKSAIPRRWSNPWWTSTCSPSVIRRELSLHHPRGVQIQRSRVRKQNVQQVGSGIYGRGLGRLRAPDAVLPDAGTEPQLLRRGGAGLRAGALQHPRRARVRGARQPRGRLPLPRSSEGARAGPGPGVPALPPRTKHVTQPQPLERAAPQLILVYDSALATIEDYVGVVDGWVPPNDYVSVRAA